MKIINKIVRVVAVPLLVTPVLLWFLATSEYFSGAMYTFWPLMLATLIINIPLVFIKTSKLQRTLQIGWAGAQIGCLMYIITQYATVLPNHLIEWPMIGDGVMYYIPDWFILSLLLGFIVGGVIDYIKRDTSRVSVNKRA